MDQSVPVASTLERLKADIVALENFDIDLLRRRWRSLMGRPTPAHLSRGLLMRILAYRLQTDALGEIDRETERALAAPGERVRSDGDQLPSVPAKASGISVRPGTLLAREYGGVMQRVMVIEEGFSWNGRMFRSLSEVATAITGTKWNGPRFFGLRSAQPKGVGVGSDRQNTESPMPDGGLTDVAKGRGDGASYPEGPETTP
jgi:hypothetical protein